MTHVGSVDSAPGGPATSFVLATSPSRGVPPAAAAVFGVRLAVTLRYVDLLSTVAVQRGLLGPREIDRLWDRHLLNCAVIAELIPVGASVIDVGSGAGLPGIALALARPDLAITLLEPMARRADFLAEAVTELPLPGVDVCRARAEEWAAGRAAPTADIVTARAVAPLDRLVRWCLPLARPGGRLLAIKGASAGAELDRCRSVLRQVGGTKARIRTCGGTTVDIPTTVIEIMRGSERAARPGAG